MELTLVRISARGVAVDPVKNNIGIKSLTVGGRVENAQIRAGVDLAGGGVDGAGNVQIGAVKVGGAWIASSLGAGVNIVNSVFGDGNDIPSTGGTHSRIASIVIGGPVPGRSGTNGTFGFAAHEIGSFNYNGIAVKLLVGAGNDLFAAGAANKAQPIGPSLSPVTGAKPDLFAVHVYEV